MASVCSTSLLRITTSGDVGMKRWAILLGVLVFLPALARADVAGTNIYVSCNNPSGHFTIGYQAAGTALPDRSELLDLQTDLIATNGQGWSSKTVTRTCLSSQGSKTFVAEITGIPLNPNNANGTCGAVFHIKVRIKHEDVVYASELLGFSPASPKGFCSSSSEVTYNQLDLNMTSGQSTLTPALEK